MVDDYKKLPFPGGRVKFILDTDTYNEVDDQFALIYAISSPDRLNMLGVTAAPFFNYRSESPADGMERSYNEIVKITEMMNQQGNYHISRGATRYLPDKNTPVNSEAVDFIISQAEHCSRSEPLYIAAIGAITNIASVLICRPDLKDNMVVVWLGGHQYDYEHNNEFNLRQDVAAAQVVFESGVNLVHVPCNSVAEKLETTCTELNHELSDCGKAGEYLRGIFTDYVKEHGYTQKVIWDISTIAFFTIPQAIQWQFAPAPALKDNKDWVVNQQKHIIRTAINLNRDMIFNDMFNRLRHFNSNTAPEVIKEEIPAVV